MTEITLSNSFGQSITVTEHGGRYYASFPNVATKLDNLRELKLRDNDVMLIAYPSSGTHWVWEITNMLLRGEARSVKGTKLELFLEMASHEEMDAVSSPRVLNTHVLPDLFSSSQLEKRKFIYVCRNPKDCTVSNFYHTFNFPSGFGFNGDFKGYCELAIEGKVTYGAWCEHTKTWETYFRSRDDIDIIYVYYEDLKEDLERGVRQLAQHLGVDANDQLVRDIAEMCTFKQMKADKTDTYPKERLKLWRDGIYNIYRKGEVGDWKNHFTVALNERFDNELQKTMEGSEIMKRIRYTI